VRASSHWQGSGYAPAVISRAIEALQRCPFDLDALERHLNGMGHAATVALGPEREHLALALRNDVSCAARMRTGCLTGPFASYQPEYRTSYTGRISERGGGAQSCSRRMKAAIFQNVPNLRNYDLKRAQAFILLQELEDAGLPHDWVSQYLNEPEANDKRSAVLGISKDAYKTCLYATIMGSTHARLFNRCKNDLYRGLLGECGGDVAKARATTIQVYDALAPLKEEVKAWHEYLTASSNCHHLDPSWPNVPTLKNASGLRFRLEGHTKPVLRRNYRSGKRDPHGGEPRVASSPTTAGVVRRSERWTNLWSD